MNASIGKVVTLVGKDARDIAKNPTMLVSVVLPVAMILLYRFVYRDLLAAAESDPTVRLVADGLFLTCAMCLSVGMIGSMTLVYGIAEEKEKHTLRTLMLANVSAGQVALSKGLISLAMMLVVGSVCFALTGVTWAMFPAFIGLTAAGSVPVILFGLVLGLASRDQMTAGLYSMPILLLCLIPMFAPMAPEMQTVSACTPLGAVTDLMDMVLGGMYANMYGSAVDAVSTGMLTPIATMLVWTLLGGIAFKTLYRKLAQDN